MQFEGYLIQRRDEPEYEKFYKGVDIIIGEDGEKQRIRNKIQWAEKWDEIELFGREFSKEMSDAIIVLGFLIYSTWAYKNWINILYMQSSFSNSNLKYMILLINIGCPSVETK